MWKDEELLEYLSIYAQENGKIPTSTDCKRGILPAREVFIRRFGSFEEARKKAGVYEILSKNYDKSQKSLQRKGLVC